LHRLADSIDSLIDSASTLSQSFTCLPRGVRSRSSCATTIEHAEREHTKRDVDQSSLQVVSRAEGRSERVAKLIFSGLCDVVE
jgi:hypothetical protein